MFSIACQVLVVNVLLNEGRNKFEEHVKFMTKTFIRQRDRQTDGQTETGTDKQTD